MMIKAAFDGKIITLILQVLPPDVIKFGTLFLLVTSYLTLGS